MKRRILLLTDSHGKELPELMMVKDPYAVVKGVIIPGADISRIKRESIDRYVDLADYDPRVILCHIGCNQTAYHPTKNVIIPYAQDVAEELKDLNDHLQNLFPEAIIFMSSLFPRIPSWSFTERQTIGYNQKAHRMGRYMEKLGLNICFTSKLWISKSKCLANPIYYKNDGLHLNDSGKMVVADTWATFLKEKYIKENFQHLHI